MNILYTLYILYMYCNTHTHTVSIYTVSIYIYIDTVTFFEMVLNLDRISIIVINTLAIIYIRKDLQSTLLYCYIDNMAK